MSEEYTDVRKNCALMFKALFTELNAIRTNDLVHIQDDIKDIRGWIRATALAGVTAIFGVAIKVIFF